MSMTLLRVICAILDGQSPRKDVVATPAPGLRLQRAFTPAGPCHIDQGPALWFVLQGRARVVVSDVALVLGPMTALVVTAPLPIVGEVASASTREPFLALNLALDVVMLGEVAMLLSGEPCPAPSAIGWTLIEVGKRLSAPLIRLLDLSHRPQAINILYPAIMREVCYRLLTEPGGETVARQIMPNGVFAGVARAVQRLRRDGDARLSVDQLATTCGMSVSSFLRAFKALTSMSPSQYRRRVQLLEARRRQEFGDEPLPPAGRGFRDAETGDDLLTARSFDGRATPRLPPTRH